MNTVLIKIISFALSLLMMFILTSCARENVPAEEPEKDGENKQFESELISTDMSEDGKSYRMALCLYAETEEYEEFSPQFYFSDGKLFWNFHEEEEFMLSSWKELGVLEDFVPTAENFDSILGAEYPERYRQSIRYAKRISFEFEDKAYDYIFLFRKGGEVLVCDVKTVGNPLIAAIKSYYSDNTSNISPLYTGCLNAGMMSISSVRHIPLFRFDTKAALAEFFEKYSDASYDIDKNITFDESICFATYRLSYDKNYKLNKVNIANGGMIAYIEECEEENSLYNGDFLLFTVKKDDISDCTSFDAINGIAE